MRRVESALQLRRTNEKPAGGLSVPECVADDINFDGTVNVLDLIDLLAFGTECP